MADEGAKKRIWKWALAACWVAAIFAGLGGLGSYMSGPQPDGEPGTAMRVVVSTVAYAGASAVVAAMFTWALFYMLVFGRRASVGKALLVLSIMIVAGFCLAAPLRFIAIMGRVGERTEAIEVWAAEGGERLVRLGNETTRQLEQVGDLSLGSMQSADDIDDMVARTQHAESIYAESLRQVVGEQAQSRGRVEQMNLTEDERLRLLGEVEQRNFTPVRRFAELRLEAARRRTAMAVRLQAARGKWTMQGGRVMFYDEALMIEMQAMAAEHDTLAADVERRRLALSGAAPPPEW